MEPAVVNMTVRPCVIKDKDKLKKKSSTRDKTEEDKKKKKSHKNDEDMKQKPKNTDKDSDDLLANFDEVCIVPRLRPNRSPLIRLVDQRTESLTKT